MPSLMWPVYRTDGGRLRDFVGRIPGPDGLEPEGHVWRVQKRSPMPPPVTGFDTLVPGMSLREVVQFIDLQFIPLAQGGFRWWVLGCDRPEELADCRGFQPVNKE